MKKLLYLKEKKEGGRKTPLSFSVPQSIARRVKKLADENGISPSDIGEEALQRFLDDIEYGNDLESAVESQQQPYQTAEAL